MTRADALTNDVHARFEVYSAREFISPRSTRRMGYEGLSWSGAVARKNWKCLCRKQLRALHWLLTCFARLAQRRAFAVIDTLALCCGVHKCNHKWLRLCPKTALGRQGRIGDIVPSQLSPRWAVRWLGCRLRTMSGRGSATFFPGQNRQGGLPSIGGWWSTALWSAQCDAPQAVEKNDPLETGDPALGRSWVGFSTTFHLLCDEHGHPHHFDLTPGQAHESTAIERLLEGAKQSVVDQADEPVACPMQLARDIRYLAERIDQFLLALEIQPLIPSKDNEDLDARAVAFDHETYRSRNIIERLIGWLKANRRIFSRFEMTAKHYGVMIKLAFIRQYLTLMC